MPLFGGAGDGGAAAQEKARQARITQGMGDINRQFSGFDDSFYKKSADDYTNYQTPQMMSDYNTTKNNLTYALARNGILNSGSAVQRNASLNKTLGQSESTIANNAQNQENQLKASVSTQKGNLVNELESSADPTAIAGQAAGAVSQLRAPSAIQPLGNLFADWSNLYLANKENQTSQPNMWNQLQYANVGTVPSSNSGSMIVR